MNEKKEMTILYKVYHNLYVNLTNRCSCSCTFCVRQDRNTVGESGSLWLSHEPSYEEIVHEFEKFDMKEFKEVVFCGFGEPTERLDVLLKVSEYVKKTYHMPIRINTNGQGDLINGESIAPKLAGLIDTVSISLNTPNPERYHELVRSCFGEKAFPAMLEFAKEVKKYVPKVVMTTVDTTLTHEEEKECSEICHKLGVDYRIRAWEDENTTYEEKKTRTV